MTTSIALPSIDHSNDLGSYLRAISAAPMLTAEKEYQLATTYNDSGDLDSARQLILAHLRYVFKVARGFTGYGLPLGDLVQEGNVGLMKAVKRFDPEQGVRLVSFAMHWIKAEIYDFILKNWRIVKVATTKSQRKLFFNLRKSKNHLGTMKNDEVEDLAHHLNVKSETVREMEMRMGNYDVSFSNPNSDDEEAYHPEDYLADTRYEPSQIVAARSEINDRHEFIQKALGQLDERSCDIIKRRWLSEESKETLHDLAAEYGVSAERIRQIEKNAMNKMKASLVS